MIDDLDEVLRQFLIQELPVKNSEVDIKFEQPKREWSARVSRPTLNLFLYDIRENRKLRQTEQPVWEIERNSDGTIKQRRRRASRFDLHYLITTWAAEPDDEHRLLARTIMAFLRHPNLPSELLPESLQDQPVPIAVQVAQEDELRNPADLWSALDNELRPTISCILTVAFNPYQYFTTPVIRTRELRIGPSADRLQELLDSDVFWTVGGVVQSDTAPAEIELRLVERGEHIQLDKDGRFAIGNLKAGEYTLEVSAQGKTKKQSLTVPSADYEIEI